MGAAISGEENLGDIASWESAGETEHRLDVAQVRTCEAFEVSFGCLQERIVYIYNEQARSRVHSSVGSKSKEMAELR